MMWLVKIWHKFKSDQIYFEWKTQLTQTKRNKNKENQDKSIAESLIW